MEGSRAREHEAGAEDRPSAHGRKVAIPRIDCGGIAKGGGVVRTAPRGGYYLIALISTTFSGSSFGAKIAAIRFDAFFFALSIRVRYRSVVLID